MAKLTIQHKGGFLAYINSGLKILINGIALGNIKGKQTKEFQLTNENHRLQIGSSWWKSREISFDSSSPKIFQVSANPVFSWTMIYFLIAIVAKIIIRSNTKIQFKITDIAYWILFGPMFLTLLYFFTIGRKNYLRVKEVNALNLSLL